MKERTLVLLLIFTSLFLFSCSRVNLRSKNTGSVSVDLTAFYNKVQNGKNLSADYSLEIRTEGDFTYLKTFKGKISELEGQVVSVEKIPIGSRVRIFLSFSMEGLLLYEGAGETVILESGENSFSLKMRKASNSPSERKIILPNPVISAKTIKSSPVVENGKMIIKANDTVIFSVSGSTEPFPEETEYSWFINGTQVEGAKTSSIKVDYSQTDFVELTNNVIVWVQADGIMKAADLSFLIRPVDIAEERSDF